MTLEKAIAEIEAWQVGKGNPSYDKLNEAITNLECLEQSKYAGLEDDEKEAIKLGIEALKWINSHRDGNWHRYNSPLPGETKE